jgi:putative endonuclease
VSREAGDRCERAAETFLHSRGLRTLCRNYRCRWGELDLVMTDGRELVVIEVRARRRAAMVSPEESIGPAKRRRLLAAARSLLAARPRLAARPLRFDVVAVTAADDDYNFRWLKDAFRG